MWELIGKRKENLSIEKKCKQCAIRVRTIPIQDVNHALGMGVSEIRALYRV